MSNNDFFQEEKCVPMRRGAKKPLPKELKPKFPTETPPPPPQQPWEPSPEPLMAPTPTPAPAETPEAAPPPVPWLVVTPPVEQSPVVMAPPITPPITPPPITPPTPEKSQRKDDVLGMGQLPSVDGGTADDEQKTPNQEQKTPALENQPQEVQKSKRKKKPPKKAPKKIEEGTAVAVVMDDDEDIGAFPDKKGKKKEAPAPGQVVFVSEDDDDKEEKKEEKKKGKKDKKKKASAHNQADRKFDRPGSVRQKKHALPAVFTFASPGAPGAQVKPAVHMKEPGSVKKSKRAPKAGMKQKPVVAAVAPPAPPKERAKEPNENFFKAMYSKAKTKIVAMSKNPNAPPSSSSSTMSGSDDTLIATDAAMNIKTEVSTVYGAPTDYPRGILPAKNHPSHPDKLFPEGRPFWMNRDEKPPEAKVILMSMVHQCVKDGTLTLVEHQDEPKDDLTPYADDVRLMKGKDEKYVLDASRILANTVHNTVHNIHVRATGTGPKANARKLLDKPKVGKLRIIPPTQSAIYNQKQQKQKKFVKVAFKTGTGTEAHKAMTKKKKGPTASTDN